MGPAVKPAPVPASGVAWSLEYHPVPVDDMDQADPDVEADEQIAHRITSSPCLSPAPDTGRGYA